ncbi:hypothetical protein R1sor_025140 [Riccia sorocarpa]|uniref:Uncharacterized protein n=1 Tax=Riccia sorocarpa TaxID=122646 RepID=A0ABD3G9A6_9MARC
MAMARSMVTLADVNNAVCNGDTAMCDRIAVHVISYDAPCAWPSKFTHHACNSVLPNGRHCLKSIERRSNCIEGHACTEHRAVYRFQLRLSDGSMHGRSLRATIFNSVSIMLRKSAVEFRNLPSRKGWLKKPAVKNRCSLPISEPAMERLWSSSRSSRKTLLAIECHMRNARNVKKFEPHMIEHGFSGVDHAANDREMDKL